jgi:hypothetical protein
MRRGECARAVFALALSICCSVSLRAQDLMTFPETAAHAPPLRPASDSADGKYLRVYLATFEAGDNIEEKFGHDALWIVDTRARQDWSYNYGIFHMDEPHFMTNFLKGRMKYSMYDTGPYPIFWDTARYKKENRTIWAQELNLTASQKASLKDFLDWNNRPEHMHYMYDYFRDNCTTRLRDALDRVLGGQIKRTLEAKSSAVTYRWQARRLLSVSPPAYAGIELAMGHAVDKPLSLWEESFLPTELMNNLRSVQVTGPDEKPVPLVMSSEMLFQATRAPMPATPPDYHVLYTVVGLVFGCLFAFLGRTAARGSRAALRGLGIIGGLWSLIVGFFGLVAMLLWFVTDHTVTRANENILQANVLSLILAVLLIGLVFGRGRSAASKLAWTIAGVSVLGFIVQILPGLDQFNGEIIGLLLPAHIGLALALRAVADSEALRPLPRDVPAAEMRAA